jgi:dTDP-4-dehydrorhamnose 3,5-epimerase
VKMPNGVEATSLPRPRIHVIETGIPGCYELRPEVLTDERGSFAKVFHRPLWEELGLCVEFNEEYVTRSLPGTLRGLHFQVPPMQHVKVVSCLSGRAWDVVLDLRKDSPTRGQYASVSLDSMTANAIYLPPGVAHGFCVPGPEALLHYKLSSVHSPAHDKGIRWDSAGIAWPVSNPILSKRDLELPRLDEFDSPF